MSLTSAASWALRKDHILATGEAAAGRRLASVLRSGASSLNFRNSTGERLGESPASNGILVCYGSVVPRKSEATRNSVSRVLVGEKTCVFVKKQQTQGMQAFFVDGFGKAPVVKRASDAVPGELLGKYHQIS